jgi:hypothetical protein
MVNNYFMRYITLIVALLILSFSCKKNVFKDDGLTINKELNNTDNLCLGGYFYTDYGDIKRIMFLYQDGVILSGGDVFEENLTELEYSFIDGSFLKRNGDKRLYWGVYIIDDDIIKFEKWYPSSGGGMPVYLHQGEILNDSTFVITKSIRSKTGEEKELDETYHFKPFSPKPDSTNNFIN